MSQEPVGPLQESVGYALKQAAAALRTAMGSALRPLDLTVAQYACLELLGQRPDLSSADLARGAFVTRQSMNEVLRSLQDRSLLDRPATVDRGRALPARLTPAGHERLHAASARVRAVEDQMLAPLTHGSRTAMLADLTACATALGAPPLHPTQGVDSRPPDPDGS